jgi:hypothetical protein
MLQTKARRGLSMKIFENMVEVLSNAECRMQNAE